MTAHSHINCKTPQPGGLCNDGVLTDACGDKHCYNEYCAYRGHCECKCHSGKTCSCGHTWEQT
jgi:hypothetical protein